MLGNNIPNIKTMITSKEEKKKREIGNKANFFLKYSKILNDYVKVWWWSHGCQLYHYVSFSVCMKYFII